MAVSEALRSEQHASFMKAHALWGTGAPRRAQGGGMRSEDAQVRSVRSRPAPRVSCRRVWRVRLNMY